MSYSRSVTPTLYQSLENTQIQRKGSSSIFPPTLLPSDDDEGLIGLGIMADGDSWPETSRHLTKYPNYQTKFWPRNISRGYRRLQNSKATWSWIFLTLLGILALLIRHRNPNSLRQSPSNIKPESEASNYQRMREQPMPIFNPTSPNSRTSLAVLIILQSSRDFTKILQDIINDLSSLKVIDSLTALCPVEIKCPILPNIEYIDSLSDYRPSPGAKDVLVLDTPPGPSNLEWINRALEISKNPARIVSAIGIKLNQLSSEARKDSLVCVTSGQDALVSAAPFIFPAHEWTSLKNSELIINPIHLSLIMATAFGWTTRALTLDGKTSLQACQGAISQLTSINQWDLKLKKIPRWAPTLGIVIGSRDLQNVSWRKLVCGLVEKFGAVVYLIDSSNDFQTGERKVQLDECLFVTEDLRHHVKSNEDFRAKMKIFFEERPNIGILMTLKGSMSGELSRIVEETISPPKNDDLEDSIEKKDMVLIQLPPEEVEGGDWILGLNLEGLRNWHKPQVDISIITNDRSQSLERLLRSLKNAKYYGDKVNLVINMEQTSDSRTKAVVSGFSWDKGSKTVRQRIILGGLLPAVIESWYPSSSHDSYGVLLEDDTEVSSQFYGWLKFALLTYRYSGIEDDSIYGISLYQPQFNELKPEGRRPFNASALLSSVGIEPVTLPYASQVPCSWGALFFPEFWKSFQRFLTFRLADRVGLVSLEDPIVASPIRSNRWPKSWKKYMIEWVYLKGTKMVYPNYQDEITRRDLSLSTNHLEPGTHVRAKKRIDGGTPLDRFFKWKNSESAEKRLERLKKGFEVSLMEENFSLLNGLGERGRLPLRGELINVDLWGELSSAEELQERGWIGARSIGICGGDDEFQGDFFWEEGDGGVRKFQSKEFLELLCGP